MNSNETSGPYASFNIVFAEIDAYGTTQNACRTSGPGHTNLRFHNIRIFHIERSGEGAWGSPGFRFDGADDATGQITGSVVGYARTAIPAGIANPISWPTPDNAYKVSNEVRIAARAAWLTLREAALALF